MSKIVEERAIALFEKIKDLRDEESIKTLCEAERKWLDSNYKHSSVGTMLSNYNKRIRTIPLIDGENAYIDDKEDGTKILKHYFFKYCGFSKKEWDERNDSDKVTKRIDGNGSEIEPDKYFELAGLLLTSEKPFELCAGLIASTGRRPVEIFIGDFKPIPGEEYKVMFKGQAKKRGVEPIFPISTLFPAKYTIKCFNRFKKTKEYLEVKGASRKEIHDRRNTSILRVIYTKFKDVLPLREGDDNTNNKALRAAYGCLATNRDYHGPLGGMLLNFARLMGHYVNEEFYVTEDSEEIKKEKDGKLKHLVTTLGYSDFYVRREVAIPYPGIPGIKGEKVLHLRGYESDIKIVKDKQAEWGLENQQDSIRRLIELAQEALEMRDNRFNTEGSNENIETMVERIVTEKLQKIIDEKVIEAISKYSLQDKPFIRTENVQSTNQAIGESKTPSVEDNKEQNNENKSSIDFSLMESSALKGSHYPGSADERIKRSVKAIMAYNDFHATSNNQRWAIVLRSVQELSGSHYKAVRKFMDDYAEPVSSHNHKYGLGQYHNKVHKNIKITDVISW